MRTLVASGTLLVLAACAPAGSDPEAAARCLAAGDPEERVAACTMAAEDETNSTSVRSIAFMQRGQVRQQQGDVEGALADYAEALALNPDNPTALLRRARLLLDVGQADAAEPLLRRAIDVHGSGMANEMMGRIALQRGQYEAAADYFTASLEQSPRATVSLAGRARARQCLGDADGARADYEAAARLDDQLRPQGEDGQCVQGG